MRLHDASAYACMHEFHVRDETITNEAQMIGMLHMTAANYYWNMPPIMGPPNIPSTPDLASSIIALDFCETAALFPSLIHAMAQKETYLEGLRKLDHISWVGGPCMCLPHTRL